MNNQPEPGDTATCKSCGGKIIRIGAEWRHNISGYIIDEPRHPAEPAAPRRIDTAILQQPVQCQVEPDGDCVWA